MSSYWELVMGGVLVEREMKDEEVLCDGSWTVVDGWFDLACWCWSVAS